MKTVPVKCGRDKRGEGELLPGKNLTGPVARPCHQRSRALQAHEMLFSNETKPPTRVVIVHGREEEVAINLKLGTLFF